MIVNNIVTGTSIKAKVGLPNNYGNEKLPLLIFLHGIGERGDNVEVVDNYGPLYQAINGIELPFIVVAPLLPANTSYSSTFINNVLEHMKSTYMVDEDRICLMGYSFGGMGTLNYLHNIENVNKLACAVVIAPGATDPTKTKPIADGMLPMIAVHGTKDDIVPCSKTLAVVRAINEFAKRELIRFDIWVGMSHAIVNKFIEAKPIGSELIYPVYNWMLSHRRSHRANTYMIKVFGNIEVVKQ